VERVGILTIGQSPRPDLEAVFRRHLPGVELIVRGALDELPLSAIEALAAMGGDYPLFTILRDGTTREISLHRLKPLLDARVKQIAADGASVAALMCAGNFPALDSPIPVLDRNRGPGRFFAVKANSSSRCRFLIAPRRSRMASSPEAAPW
jgi:protein AroM